MVFSTNIFSCVTDRTSVFRKPFYCNERNLSYYLNALQSISENAGNTRAVFESLQSSYSDSIPDFISKLNHINPNQMIIDRLDIFLRRYQTLFQDFICTKLGQDETILAYKEYIETYSNPVPYENTLYMYTNLGYNMTCTQFKNGINTVLCNLVRDLKDFSGYKRNYGSFQNVELGEKRLLEYEEEMNQVYQSVLGLDYEVSKRDLSAELYHYYRQGKLSENDLVPPSCIQRILQIYLSLNKVKAFVINHKQKTFQSVQELQDFVRATDLTKYIRSSITSQECKAYVSLIETTIRKIDEICDFYLQKLGAWLDSIQQENYCYEDFLKEVLRLIKEENDSDMVTMEDYLFNYDIYLAEQELFDSLLKIQSSSIIKEANLVYINESVKDTIMRYINKISTAIEGSWNKFKQTVLRDVDKKYLDSIRDKMQNSNPKFTISNFPTYNTTKLDEIKLIPFDYAQMKDHLESKKAFLEQYYPDIAKSEKSTIETIEGLTITGRQDTRCTPELLKTMYQFASSDFEGKIQTIEADLKTVNTSNKNIQQLANQITQGTTTTPATPAQEENENNQNQTTNQAGNQNQEGGNKVGYKDDETQATKDNSSLIKQISNYVGASTDILSAKMKIYRDIYALYMKTLRHYTRSEDKKQQAQKQQQVQEPKKPQVEQPKTQVTI